MNHWLGVTVMREEAKIVGRRELSVGCACGKLRRDINAVRAESKNTTWEESNNRPELSSTAPEVTRRAQDKKKKSLCITVPWKKEKATAML